METPEIEFFLYMLTRYIEANGLNPDSTSISELFDNINLNLTPIGGG